MLHDDSCWLMVRHGKRWCRVVDKAPQVYPGRSSLLVLRSARSICLLAHRPSGAESVASATVPYLELGKCRALNDKKTGIYNFLVALCHDIVGKLGMSPPAGGGSWKLRAGNSNCKILKRQVVMQLDVLEGLKLICYQGRSNRIYVDILAA